MDEAKVIAAITSLPRVTTDDRTTEQQLIYAVDGQMFAIIKRGSNPLALSLLCDRNLGRLLESQYESVLPGQGLSKQWITILLTGQLSNEDIIDQIRHAYEQARTPDNA